MLLSFFMSKATNLPLESQKLKDYISVGLESDCDTIVQSHLNKWDVTTKVAVQVLK